VGLAKCTPKVAAAPATNGGEARARTDVCGSVTRAHVCRGGRRGVLCRVMSSPVVTRVASVIVVTVMSVIVVTVVSRRRWRCNEACDRPYSSTHCGAQGRTVTAGSGSPDCSSTACADETAANKTLHRIVWIGASRRA
jgi:hypothetical protein